MTTLYGPILIVEDVPNVLELLEVTLRFKGYAVLTARNGEEALDVIARQKPVLIITDILMPKLDGYAFVQKLRLNPETRSIPVVFLSATYVTPEDKDFALSLGAARFLRCVSATRTPWARASSQLASAAANDPACSGPVGDGAKRPRYSGDRGEARGLEVCMKRISAQTVAHIAGRARRQ